jgi:hypothetical protein
MMDGPSGAARANELRESRKIHVPARDDGDDALMASGCDAG